MNKTSLNFFTILGFIFLFVFIFQSAQASTSAIPCPDYFFATELAKGASSPDVKVIQQILNLDKRTTVAYSGPGSAGNETNYFGVATREALKRFQALFIEYISIANGKFGSKTRVSMNAVCRGPFFTGGGGSVYDKGTVTVVKDRIAPIIAVAGPTSTDITTAFRAYLKGSEALQTPALSGLIIQNGTAGDMRKVSSTTFSFLVTPNSDAKDSISLQFEANSVSDLAGNTNENASNEWSVFVYGAATNTSTTTGVDTTIDDILKQLQTGTSTDCSAITSVDVSDYSNPCYGKVPLTNNAANQSQDQSKKDDGQSMQMIMGLLQGLLKGLTGLGGGGMADGGGKGAAPGRCECPGPLQGQPTIGLFGLSGPSGRFLDSANPGMGNYTGKIATTPPGVCGQMVVKGQCINPLSDSTGMGPVMGSIPPAPAFIWGGR